MKKIVAKILSVLVIMSMLAVPVYAGSTSMVSDCEKLIAQGVDIEFNIDGDDSSVTIGGTKYNCATSQHDSFNNGFGLKSSDGLTRTFYFENSDVKTKINSLIKSEITDKSNNSFKLDNILNEGGKAVNEIAKEVKPQIDLQRASNDVPFFDSFMSRILSVIIKIGWGLYTIFVVFSMVLVCMPVARKLCLTETGEKKDSGIGGWLAGFVTQSTLEAIEETKNPADGKPRLPIFIFIEKEAGVFAGLVIATVLIPFGLLNTIASYLVEWFTGIIG